MALAPWRSLVAHALHRNRSLPYARYAQLATTRPDGRPANRTIVFRGFLEDTNQLKFITDARSEKPGQVERSQWGELCWYFPTTREQFRITGTLHLIRDSDPDERLRNARQQLWQDLSDHSRIQFAWADPGKPRAAAAAFSPTKPSCDEALPNFCLLLLEPTEVDHLELQGEPQNRNIYHRLEDGEWNAKEVNP